ncbi:hypothetical protein D9758_010456 [Tetrapyrgos nigripes]|uniref:Uncharacterized protein n=1 Tax=Tetrapyrgos nigripes TaxID=182062 RepID=A0A8H5FPR0_9AGAR|nr:hypothetical protein D9758_010456 [Tetrapyrgos nigripes]
MAAIVDQGSASLLQGGELPHSHLEFQLSSDRTQYIRRIHGRERFSASASQYSEGSMHQSGNAHLLFKEPISRQKIYTHARAAWMKLRFHAPWIAYRCTPIMDDPEPNSFLFSYDIIGHNSKLTANGLKDLEAWADESIRMREQPCTFAEWEMEMKEKFWNPNDRLASELHIARGINDKHWFTTFCTPDWSGDARAIFSVCNVFLKLLTKEVQASNRADSPLSGEESLWQTQPNFVPYQELAWGEEVCRLTPSSTVFMPDAGKEVALKTHPFTKIVFERIPFPSQSIPISVDQKSLKGDSLLEKIILSPSETQAINLACQKTRCSLTVLLNSVLLLADVEKALRTLHAESLIQNSPSLSTLIEENWLKSEVFCIPANPVNMRAFIWPKDQVTHEQCTSGGIFNLMVPSYHSMNAIRKCLSFKDGKVHRTWYDNPTAFWGELLPDTDRLLKAGAKQPPSAYHLSASLAERMAPVVGSPCSESLYVQPIGIMPSSIGNMERLGLYNDFSPLAQKEKISTNDEPPFLVPEMSVGVRSHNTPAIVISTWEYNGSMVLNVQASKRHQTAEGWEIFSQAVKDGLKHIVEGVLARGRKENTRAVL